MDKTIILTERLLSHLHKLKQNYENSKQPKNDKHFFQYVKRETDPIFDLLDEWENSVVDLIQQQEISLNLQQINATKDNIRALLLHSYYIDVRKRRYMEIFKSCEYILSVLLKEIK